MSDITNAQMREPFERSSLEAFALNAGSVLHHLYYFLSAIVAGLLVYALLMAFNGHARTADGRLDFGFLGQQSARKAPHAQIAAGSHIVPPADAAHQLP